MALGFVIIIVLYTYISLRMFEKIFNKQHQSEMFKMLLLTFLHNKKPEEPRKYGPYPGQFNLHVCNRIT
jgi:hypothetical protein